MPAPDSILSDFFFSLTNVTFTQLLDLVLVTVVFFGLLQLLRRSRATLLLRGTLVVIAFFFIVTVFLPLPTFDYLLEVALIATLVAIPIIFQPELRHLLESLGRRVGTFRFQQMAAESTLKPLVRALENLSDRCVGALIVLEGNEDLSDIIQTGVPMGGEVTSELLQTIFYDGTPLHDGAVIIRGNRVLAAGCVLPVSNRQLYAAQRRLGTRHRAAVGMTETSDALVLVVSEETGAISVARDGRLQSGLDRTALREQIHNFYQSGDSEEDSFSLQNAVKELREWWRRRADGSEHRFVLSDLGLFLVSFLLALTTWAFVIQETNPIQEMRITDIPLQVTEVPPNTQLLTDVPDEIAAVVRAPNAMLNSLAPSSFQAQVSLLGLEPGLHRLPVTVQSGVEPVQIRRVEPQTVDVQLAEIVTRSLPVEVMTSGEEILSPALEIGSSPVVTPSQVLVSGAAPTVARIDRVLAEIAVPEATGTIERPATVRAVDQDGEQVTGVNLEPDQVIVGVTVAQQSGARTMGVRVVTEGELPDGYRLARITVEPDQVTLLGTPEQLDEIGNVITTFPVDMTQAVDDFSVQVPLDLPPNIQAIDALGNSVRSVQVAVEVEVRMANRVVSRPVEVVGSVGLTANVQPATVDVALHGPLPLLDEIEAEAGLLRVVIEATELADMEPDESRIITPQLIKPDEVRAQLIPQSVTVTVTEPQQ
jgi:diadenylate cyclase